MLCSKKGKDMFTVCITWQDRSRLDTSSTACATKTQSAHHNTGVSFFFAEETVLELQTVFHQYLFSCWYSDYWLYAQQIAFRGDLHTQSNLEIAWVISAEIKKTTKKTTQNELIQSTVLLFCENTCIHLYKTNKTSWYVETLNNELPKLKTKNRENKLNIDGLNKCCLELNY